jgi:hypothetical protein
VRRHKRSKCWSGTNDQPVQVHAKVSIDFVEPSAAKQLAAWFFVAGQSIMVAPDD